MTSRFTRVALLCLSVVGLSACKNEETSVDEYVTQFALQVCTGVEECDCEYPEGKLYDHCLAQLAVTGETLSELNSVEGLQFDGECAQRFIDTVDELGCGVPNFDPDAECEKPCKIWHGPMGSGGTCTSINGYDNCKQGLVCSNEVCVDPCAEPDLPNLNELCAPEYGCDEGLYCDVESEPLAPTCARLPGENETCIEYQFGGWLCGEGLFCDLTNDPVCLALPGLGDECPNFECEEGLYCDTNEAPATCAAPPTLGQDCPLGLCQAPYVCDVDQVCAEPQPAVCGYYGGLPPDQGDGDTTDATTDTTGDGDTTDTTDTTTGGGCAVDEFQCIESLECIPGTWLCDGVSDCADGSDEAAC
ncbi:LDL receptor domain-containing protein [Nannocystaceae bacterium ST9]